MRHKTQAILESGLQIPTGAAAGRVLASDGSGNAAWAANAVADADAYALRAGVVVNGGGQIDVDGTGRIKWGTRFLVMANGRGATIAPGGYFDITMPAVGTVIPGVGGSAGDTVTAAGILLAAWTSLFYILPIGGASTSLPANFRLATYTADFVAPASWIMLAIRNSDPGGGVIVPPRDVIIGAGQSLVSPEPVPRLSLNDLHVAAANKDGAVGTASMRTLAVGALAGVGQAMPGYATLDQIANPVAARVMNGQKITGLADPTGFMDGANKQYVDRSASKAFAMAVS
jgi:hypothetical protein